MATPTAADPGAVQPPTRATAPQTPRVAGLESLLQPIRQQILQAVKVLFDRSITPPGNPDDPRIVDNKPSLPNTGTVQDCEFGMILLLVRNWIGEHFFQLTSINPAAFEQVTLSLVARTIKRVIERQTDDEGGGGSCRVFFNGSPYTKYGQDMYSANLDAAMLILAFLAMALEDYSDQLANADHGISADLPENAQPAQWVRTLRDAALYVILEGLNYALDCRVTAPGKGFIGFTCDPENRAANSRDEDFLSDFDRLFFTWTACETIHDLVAWRDSYFRPVAADALPPDVVRDMSSKLGELQKTVGEAAAWSQQFLARFQVLRIDGEKFSQIVDRIEPYGKRQISDEQDKQDLKEMTEIVRYVYYIPQYAAIRSLGPQNTITLDEAELVAAKLNDLVLYGIIGSDLDAAKQRNLYDSLTRKYWLGRGEGVAKQEYADDAWYPLVVRSLSGLLSRTLDDIGQRFTRSEVINLINSYDRILQIQYNNLIKRRPGADEVHKQPELMKLWSYVDKGPYVLYSTQRTIFALIEYSKFVRKAAEFSRIENKPAVEERERELSMLLAKKFAEVLIGPEIRKWIADLPSVREQGVIQEQNNEAIRLPDSEWAADLIRKWLDAFVQEFNEDNIAADLDTAANELERIEQTLKTDESRRAMGLRNKHSDILQINGSLKKADKLDADFSMETRRVLLSHLLCEYVHPANSKTLKQLLNTKDENSLWQRIKGAALMESALHTQAT